MMIVVKFISFEICILLTFFLIVVKQMRIFTSEILTKKNIDFAIYYLDTTLFTLYVVLWKNDSCNDLTVILREI